MSRMQNALLPVAIFFSLLPLAGYQVGAHRWTMLGNFAGGAIASAFLAATLWILYVAMKRRTNPRRA